MVHWREAKAEPKSSGSVPAPKGGHAMTSAEKKLASKRLSVLELAETLGNVYEACRRRGVDRSRFYGYKRRSQTHGLQGSVDLPPIHETHQQTTPPEVERGFWNWPYSSPHEDAMLSRTF